MIVLREAHAVNEYFDINGATAGSGVAASGSYNWDTGSGSNAWSTDATGASATTAWPDGDSFARFAAGTDAAANNYTVTVSANHTFAGMVLQFNGGGSNVTIANSGGAVLTMNSNVAGQGFFVGSTGSTGTQGLTITAPIAGDAVTPLFWSGALPTGTSGSLFLYGNNTYAGGTVINSSAGLNFNNANSFGTGPITQSGTNTFGVLANPTVGNFTIANPLTMRDSTAANITMLYTGTAPVTFSDWTLGASSGTFANIITVGNNTFTTAKFTIGDGTTGIKGGATSAMTVTSGNGINGTLIVNGASTYGGNTQIGANAASTGQPTLQANDGTGLPSASFLVLNGGVLQTSGSFTRDINTSNAGGPRMEWGANGGGFSAIGGQLTVDIGANNGNAGVELPWSTVLGSGIMGPLRFGSITSNAKVLFIDPIDLNAAAGTTRTITVTAGAGGDLTEMNQVIRNSQASNAVLQKNGAGTLILSAANTYTGNTQVTAGALQATDGTGLPTASLLSLDGGVLQGSGVTSFTRPLAASGTSVQWTANGGGFSANGGLMTVNIGGANAPLVWGTTVGSQIVGPLIFGSNTANAKTQFVNPIDLGAAARTVTVNAGVGGDSAELSGVLSSSGAGSLTKNGTGTLLLSAANTYTGGTTLSAGTLQLGNTGALPAAGNLTLGGGTLSNVSGGAITESNATTLTANTTVLTPSAAQTLTFSGSFTNSGGNRTLTGGNGAGTAAGVITLSGNVFLSEVTGTGRTLTLTAATSSAPTFVVSGNIANFSGGAGTAGSLTIGGTSAATSITATLSGNNTYSGNTTLNTSSTLKLGSATAVGASTFVIGGNGSFDNTTGAPLVLTNNMNQSGGSPTFIGTNDLTLGNVALSAANRTITVSANTLTVNNVTQDASARNYTKAGAGKLVINGAGSYTGTTTISAGTLQLGNGGTTGSLSTTSAIVDNATLAINRSNAVSQGTDFSGAAITGTGSLTQAGSGTTTLTIPNTFSGTTRSAAGTLSLGDSLALQNSTLDMNGADAGSVSFGTTNATLGNLTGSRNLTLPSGVLSVGNNNGSPAAYSGSLSGVGSSLTKLGTGTLVLSGANSYSGGTTVSNGILSLSGATATLGSGDVTVQGTNVGTELIIQSGVANAIADGKALSLAGGGTAGVADQGFADLGAGLNEVVASLVLGGVAQPAGTYGGTGSGATNILPEYFAADTGIVTVPSVGVPGDWNGDGHVDAADYVTWRKDPAGHGGDPAGYDTWRMNFGIAGSGAGNGSALNGSAVPEPACIVLAALGLAALALRRRVPLSSYKASR